MMINFGTYRKYMCCLSTKRKITDFVYCFVLATPGGVHELLLHSGNTPGELGDTIWDGED